MSVYELQAEEKGYSYFVRRLAVCTYGHFHGAYEFVFQKDGEQEVLIGGEKRVLHGGDACFVDCFCVHSYAPIAPSNCYIIVGDKDAFERIFAEYGGEKPPRFFTFAAFDLLDDLYGFCRKPFQNPQNRRVTFEGAMRVLTAEIAEKVPFVTGSADKQCSLVCQVLSYANEYYDRDLSLRTLAKTFGYSQEHLSRVLHKYLAENWNGYIGRLRARRTQEILERDKQANVLDAAFSCGFESANTFYRAYKKTFGRSPRQNLT